MPTELLEPPIVTTEDDESAFETALATLPKPPAVPDRYVDGVLVVWSPQPGSQQEFMRCPLFECLYHGTRGPGKDVSVDTLVLTDRGWIRAGDVTMRDRLVALDGTYTRLFGIFPKRDRDLYRVTFTDGVSVLADDEHRWLVLNGKTGYREGGWKVRTTRQIREASVPYSIPFLQGAAPGREWTGLDPYMVGLMLGDGTMRSARVTLYSADEEILEYAESLGWNRYQYGDQIGRAVCPEREAKHWRALMPSVLSGDKSVPRELMDADPSARLAVLQGLMDSDGTIESAGKQRFVSKSERLALDVAELAMSLGGCATVYHEDRPSPKGGVDWRWRVNLRHNNQFNPFRLKRKAERIVEQRKFLTRGIKSIEFERKGDGVCFSVTHESHCFVVGGPDAWIVTHNTDALLMDFGQHVGRGFGPAWRGILFRETYPQLADVVLKSERWFRRIWPNARFNRQRMSWEWPTGEVLFFRHMREPRDYWNYHGHEYPWIAFEELTNWPTDECFRSMFACCRSAHPGVPRKIRATTNPYGVGHNWVKARYKLFGQWWRTQIITDSKDVDGNLEPPRAAIHGHLRENRILLDADPNYPRTIASAASSKAMADAWLRGSWDIVAGGMFDDVWSPKHNIVPRFAIPSSWRIDRSFDWGSARPFSVGWWAESDGSDLALSDGRVMSTVRGDLFRVAEWYGCTGRPNEGLRMLAVDVAKGIVERELLWGWRSESGTSIRVKPGPADSAIFTIENGRSIAHDMQQPMRIDGRGHRGIVWTRADKRPGSRRAGWEQLRAMLKAAHPEKGIPREKPGVFVVGEACPDFLRTVPNLPRDDKDMEDVDTDAEDHTGDETRYRIRSSGMRVGSGTTGGHGG